MMRLVLILLTALLSAAPLSASAASGWSVEEADGALRVSWQKTAVARYVYDDPKITRPYFCDLCSPAGVQVTRNHPPLADADRMDHPEFHPGVWLAFGDLNGADNWRLRARVVHGAFIARATQQPNGPLSFIAENHYLDADGKLICKSNARHTLEVTPRGLLVTYDETFSSEEVFVFGDQEEMGFGVRLATPLRVELSGPDPAPPGTGEMVADGGRRGSTEIWGQPAKWLDYRGQIDGEPAGVAIFCHPDNFRPSRMHARDYGFVCANPFATAAFKGGDPSRTVVRPGESLRLRYAVLCHSGTVLNESQLDAAYKQYADGAEE